MLPPRLIFAFTCIPFSQIFTLAFSQVVRVPASQPRAPEEAALRAANRFKGVEEREAKLARQKKRDAKAARHLAREKKRSLRERRRRAGEVVTSRSDEESGESTESDASSSHLDAEA